MYKSIFLLEIKVNSGYMEETFLCPELGLQQRKRRVGPRESGVRWEKWARKERGALGVFFGV